MIRACGNQHGLRSLHAGDEIFGNTEGADASGLVLRVIGGWRIRLPRGDDDGCESLFDSYYAEGLKIDLGSVISSVSMMKE